jgi:hypothetical protein
MLLEIAPPRQENGNSGTNFAPLNVFVLIHSQGDGDRPAASLATLSYRATRQVRMHDESVIYAVVGWKHEGEAFSS